MDKGAYAVLVAVDKALAAQDAEAAAQEAWMAAIRAYAARHPSPPRRKGWAAYERWQATLDRAVKAEYDAYVVAQDETKRTTAMIFASARAERA
jgi:hypothetical protein